MITRIVAGETTRRVAGGGVVGALLSLGTQATMTAVDTPDTRSWSTLPARIAFGRVRVPPGRRVIRLQAQGVEKRQVIDLPKGGWAVVPLTVSVTPLTGCVAPPTVSVTPPTVPVTAPNGPAEGASLTKTS